MGQHRNVLRLHEDFATLRWLKDFEQDAFGFQQKVEDIDRRLGTVFIQAFDDASDLEHAFKLLDMFGSLLERPVIAADAADKYSVLISMFSRALDHARLIYSRHIQTELKLGGYQEKLYADWSQTVSEKSQYNLTQPLICRLNLGTGKGELSDVPMVLMLLAESRGCSCTVDCWGVWDHISMVMDDVHDLEQRIQKAKNNVEEIQTIVGSWASPIFVRRDCKTESLLSLEDCQDRLERRYSLVRESGQRIHLLVKDRLSPAVFQSVFFFFQENQSLLLADPASDIWKAYVDYVDEIVLDGFFTAIECSLKYLLENTDPKAGLAPLFEVQLDLVIPDLIFQPSLDPGTNDGFYDMVEGLLNDIYRISSLVPRLAEHSGFLHYQVRGCGAPSCWWQ
ncbi:hypothetical protein Q9233_014176 [Columba guinea]|nr:hypothetical protein Q9233_014176 [Columba guinea]